jgi:predicted component of type VI protein secretion system
MVDRPKPPLGGGICLHLLDSSQGHPVQSWRFTDQAEITIGREDGNDIVISDPHVSRVHAKLAQSNGEWTLVSLGRHGTLIDDRLIAEQELHGQVVVFRLGPTGPMLRFERGKPAVSRTETMDFIDPDMFSLLSVDEQRKKQEVDQIVGNDLFEQLRNQSQRIKATRKDTED